MPRITWARVPAGFDARVAAAGLDAGACPTAMTVNTASMKATARIRMLNISRKKNGTSYLRPATTRHIGESPENAADFSTQTVEKPVDRRRVTAPLRRFGMGFHRFAPRQGVGDQSAFA